MRFLSVIVAGLLAFAPGVAADASGSPGTRNGVDASTQSFRSAPALHPPVVFVSGRDPDPQYGDIVTDANNPVQPGAIILSPQGQLIWFGPVAGGRFDVEVQRYQGRSVLTFWQGGGGVLRAGKDMILNHHYQTVAVVHAGNGYATDPHEFTITPHGTALISAYKVIPANLTSVGGPRHGAAARLGHSGNRHRHWPRFVAVAGFRPRAGERQLRGQAGQGRRTTSST